MNDDWPPTDICDPRFVVGVHHDPVGELTDPSYYANEVERLLNESETRPLWQLGCIAYGLQGIGILLVVYGLSQMIAR